MADQEIQNNQLFTLLSMDTNITSDILQPIGLIQIGAIGYMYAKLLSQAG